MNTPAEPAAESNIERIEFVVAILIQAAILIIAFTALINGLWLTAFSGAIVFLLTFAPSVLERQLQLPLPVEISLFTSVFLFASYVLGEVSNFYERLWWWDMALHASSAFVIGLIGFLAVYVFYMTNRIQVTPIYVAAITFGTAVTFGTLWEIFEFLMDLSFGLNMQKSGLVDTMTDLMVNAGGALTAAVLGYSYVRYGEQSFGRNIIRAVVERHHARRANTK